MPDYSSDVMYDSDNAFGHMIKIVPVKDVKRLEIKWPMLHDSRNLWEGDPLSYISHLIGHEGKNSLLSELIRMDLATSISAGNYKRLQN
jgi:insulysin